MHPSPAHANPKGHKWCQVQECIMLHFTLRRASSGLQPPKFKILPAQAWNSRSVKARASNMPAPPSKPQTLCKRVRASNMPAPLSQRARASNLPAPQNCTHRLPRLSRNTPVLSPKGCMQTINPANRSACKLQARETPALQSVLLQHEVKLG